MPLRPSLRPVSSPLLFQFQSSRLRLLPQPNLINSIENTIKTMIDVLIGSTTEDEVKETAVQIALADAAVKATTATNSLILDATTSFINTTMAPTAPTALADTRTIDATPALALATRLHSLQNHLIRLIYPIWACLTTMVTLVQRVTTTFLSSALIRSTHLQWTSARSHIAMKRFLSRWTSAGS